MNEITSSRKDLFWQAPEWAKHKAVWTAWPSHAELWQENLEKAQAEFVELCFEISRPFGDVVGETLQILVPDEANRKQAEQAFQKRGVKNFSFSDIPFGDIWLRDTAPIFVQSNGATESLCFTFNGWGEKYLFPEDSHVAERIASRVYSSHPERINKVAMVLEGGSIETDGQGTIMSSKQCLLNLNRNPTLNISGIEQRLMKYFGGKKVIWVNEGLINDHTDGHIDTIARFIGPGKVVCMRSGKPTEDPNYQILENIYNTLVESKDASGRALQVVTIPSPGLVESEDGEIMPASFVNFYIGNSCVVVPTYGTPYDQEVVNILQKHFPNRRVVGKSARAILSGGGAFHCITQQEPEWSDEGINL